jgi:hypothetical protein
VAENWPELAVLRAGFATPIPKTNITGFWSAGLKLTNIYTIRNYPPSRPLPAWDRSKPPIPRNRRFERPGASWSVLEQVPGTSLGSHPRLLPRLVPGTSLGSSPRLLPRLVPGTSLGSHPRLLPRLVPGTSLDTTPDRVLTQVWVASLQSDAGVGGLTHVGVLLLCRMRSNAP